MALFRKLDEKRKGRLGEKEPVFESIVRMVVEHKAKRSTDKTIEPNDLRDIFPDLFAFPSTTSPAQGHTELVQANDKADVEILEDASLEVQPTGVEGFSQLFKSRYEKIVKILAERPEGRQLTKISRLNQEKGNVKVAGLVYSKKTAGNGLEFTIDDDTGSVSLLALSSEAKKGAGEIALDQCIMVDADIIDRKLIAKNIIQPDIPRRVSSTSKKTAYAVFLSDLHIGSNKFMDSAFNRFLEWLAGGDGSQSEEDEEIIQRLKYVVIGGDIVDGVGVFPNQEYE
jgi:DNA polymerase II small subunit